MSDNGKGSKRRPAAVPLQTWLHNYENTFGPRPTERPADAPAAGSASGTPPQPGGGEG